MALTRVYGGGTETTKGERLGVRRDGDGLYVVTRCGSCRSNGTATATNECRLALAETYHKRPVCIMRSFELLCTFQHSHSGMARGEI